MSELECLKPPPPTRFNYLSLGAGVQSSALALMLALGEITPQVDGAIFADTQAEPIEVYQWLDYLDSVLPFPVYRVSYGDLTEYSLKVRERKRDGKPYIASMVPFFTLADNGKVGLVRRQCTERFKIEPIHKELKRLCGIKRGQKEPTATQLIGISWDEIQRMKESRDPWLVNRWPLLEKRMTRRHCKEWLKANGYPEPPRSACVYCPYKTNEEWRHLKKTAPESWQEAIEFERKTQQLKEETNDKKGVPFLHSSCQPLDQVDLSTDAERGQESFNFGNECAGICGV